MEVIPPSGSSFCSSCGKEVSAHAFFCSNCGHPFGSKSARQHGHHHTYDPGRPVHTENLALISLLISVFGFFFAGFFAPLVGVILGHVALRRINRSGGELGGRGMARAALIVGYFALIVGLILMIAIGTFIGLALSREGFHWPWCVG